MITKVKGEGGLGISKAKEKNLVYLASLVWRLLKNLSLPWCYLITSKYAYSKKFTNLSLIWKSIIQRWKLCNSGILWHPSKNLCLNIWHNNWIYNTLTLRSIIEGPLNISDLNLSLGNLYKGKVWDISKISFELPPDIINSIYLTPTPSKNSMVDDLSWKLNSMGALSAKSCYQLLNEASTSSNSYKWIWDLLCPNKIKIFPWKCSHNRVPYRAYLSKIGINIDATCTTCRMGIEDIHHSFLHCTSSLRF